MVVPREEIRRAALPPALPGIRARPAMAQNPTRRSHCRRLRRRRAATDSLLLCRRSQAKPGTMSTIQVPRRRRWRWHPGLRDPDGLPGTATNLHLRHVDRIANPWIELLGPPTSIPARRFARERPTTPLARCSAVSPPARRCRWQDLCRSGSHRTRQRDRRPGGRFTDISGIELPDVYHMVRRRPDRIRRIRAVSAIGGTSTPGRQQSSTGGATSFPQGNDDVEIWDLGGPIIRDAESVRTFKLPRKCNRN